MFSPAATTPFGQAASTPTFGAPAPFGNTTPAANNQSAGGFGFGSTANTTPSFGANTGVTTTTSTGFGGFGSTNTSSAFGSSAATTSAQSPFGAPAPASGGLFGAPAPAPATGGLFGAPAATTNAFGAPSPAPATGFGGFGAPAPAPATGGLFGAPAPAPATGGLFGAPAPAAGGLFGSPAPASTGFGSAAAAPASTGFGGFGAPAAAQTVGTASTPYSATTHPDGNDSITLQAISAMAAFQDKSFEELRVEDYTNGNKGTQGKAPAATGFGATTSTGFGGFGSPAPAPAAGSVFGAPAAAPAAGGLFGAPAPAPATGGLFGAPAPAPATGGLFGAPAPATGGLFGAPAPAPVAGGLFGAPPPAPASGGLFGAPAAAPAAGGLFGAPAPAPAAGGLFGAPAPAPAAGGLFGAPAPAPAAGGLFGAPAPAPAAGGLFGAPAAVPAAGGLFGAPAAAPAAGGLFGAPAPAPAAGGLFGAPAPAPAAGGLFGAPAPAGGLFGAPAPAPVPTAIAPYVPPAPPHSDLLLAQQLAAVEEQKKELALLEPWRGNSTDGSSIIPSSLSERDAAAFSGPGTNGSYVTELGRSIPSYASASVAMNFQSPRSLTRIRPRGFGSSKSYAPKIDASSLRTNGSNSLLSPDSFISSSAKRLVIQPGSLSKPKMKLALTNGSGDDFNTNENKKDDAKTLGDIQKENNSTPSTVEKKKLLGNGSDVFAGGFTSPSNTKSTNGKNANEQVLNGRRNGGTFTSPTTPSQTNGYSYELYREIVASPDVKVMSPSIQTPNASNDNNQLYVPKLTKSGYIVSPSIEDMSSMSEADLAAVSRFMVSRPGFGSVAWDGAVDIRYIDLDSVVCIREKEVIVYEKEEADGNKPDVGSKLNRPAVITLNKIYSKGGKDASSEAKLKFSKKLEKKTEKMDAEFVSYDPYDGIWKFRTKHFSRYGLDSDDEDEEDEMEVEKVQPSANSEKLYLVPGDGVSTLSKGRFGMDENKAEENVMMVSDYEDASEGNEKSAIVAAENAYRSFLNMETSAFDSQMEDENMDQRIENQLVNTGAVDTNLNTPLNSHFPNRYVVSQEE